MLIYVAGPYSAPTEEGRLWNVRAAMQAGLDLMALGHWPFVPHLTHYFDVWHEDICGHRLDSEKYMAWDFAFLSRCDGLLFLGASPGANRERVLAEELGIRVYESVEELSA